MCDQDQLKSILKCSLLVKCNSKEALLAEVERLSIIYAKLSNTEIRANVEGYANTTCAQLKSDELSFKKEGLEAVADLYASKIQWIEQGLPKAWPVLDMADEAIKHNEYVGMGVGVLLHVRTQEQIHHKWINDTLKATDTEENLFKKYIHLKEKVLSLLQEVIDHEVDIKKDFWVVVHQEIKDFMAKSLDVFEVSVKGMNTTDIRAKNIQKMIDELELTLAEHDFRDEK